MTSSFRSRSHGRRAGLCVLLAAGSLVVPIVAAAAPAQAAATTAAPSAQSVIGLRRGARGEAVKVVQRALITRGVGVAGGADGIFGPATETAVKRFQQAKGIAASGAVDAVTAQSLGLTSTAASLRVGSQGAAVKRMQQALVNAGVRVAGGADGVFGSATQAAVRAFQRARGLSVTGVLDGATAAALGLSGGTDPAHSGVSPGTYIGLRLGSRGAAVKAVQRAIIATGMYLAGGADGVFGAATQNALMIYQRTNGIPPTGTVDARTAELMRLGSTRAPTTPSTPRLLQRGARGTSVRQLQEALLRAGIAVPGGADGIFGPATEAALKSFQQRKGLPATGRLDAATARALNAGGSTPQTPSVYVGLRLGSRGDSVKAVQRAIMATGLYLAGGADGVFGAATRSALILYQRTNGLQPSGVVDSATVRMMGLGGTRPGGTTPGGGTAPGYARYDERGIRVVALQQALIRAGISVGGGADGIFGSRTAQAVITFQRAHGLSATGKVDESTARALGLRPMDPPSVAPAPTVHLDAKPVEGPCWAGDTWLAPRGSGRVHLGVDIVAAQGKDVYAVTTGRVIQIYRDYPGSLSGNGLKIARADGTYFFYAHLRRLARGIHLGVPVSAGQRVGFVGETGNAGTPHLHFEVHPGGGAAVNPYPIVMAKGPC